MRLQEIGLGVNFWYLDDGILCGRISAIKSVLALLRHHFPEFGLTLNAAKCKLFGPAAPSLSDPEFDGIPKVADGSVFLGTPVGDVVFVHHHLDDMVEKLRSTLLSKISTLRSSAKFLIWRLSSQSPPTFIGIQPWEISGRAIVCDLSVGFGEFTWVKAR